MPVSIEATLSNPSGDLVAEDARTSIQLPPGLELQAGSAEQTVSGGSLDPGEESEAHTWTVAATTDGPKQVTITGTGTGLGTTFTRKSEVTVKADCVPPGTVIDSGPGGITNAPSITFGFSALDGGTGFECAWDGGSFAPCESPVEVDAPADGPHDFAVRSVDPAGNRDPSPAAREFVVDRTVLDPTLRKASARVRRKGRTAGSVHLGLAEPGSVQVAATAKIGKRGITLERRSVQIGGASDRRVKVHVPERHRLKIRRAIARGRTVTVSVDATFRDGAGNEVQRATKFAVR